MIAAMRSLAPRLPPVGPQIATMLEAHAMAELGPEWRIVARDRSYVGWRYLGDLNTTERHLFRAGVLAGVIVATTRREPGGGLVLLARRLGDVG